MLGGIAAWRDQILESSAWLAAAITGDVVTAVDELRLDPSRPERHRLLRFIVSDEAAAVRRALGLRG
jgi:hypothetical protein